MNNQRNISAQSKSKGYLVRNSVQYDKHSSDKPVTHCKQWKTTIQTPYSVMQGFSSVENKIIHDLDDSIFQMLGIDCRVSEPVYEGICTFEDYDDRHTLIELNGVINWTFTGNYNTGYWEVCIWHTLPIVVPQELRANT